MRVEIRVKDTNPACPHKNGFNTVTDFLIAPEVGDSIMLSSHSIKFREYTETHAIEYTAKEALITKRSFVIDNKNRLIIEAELIWEFNRVPNV